MAGEMYVSGRRQTYTPRHFSPSAPRVKTKLVCGKIVKVLEEDDGLDYDLPSTRRPEIIQHELPRRYNYANGTRISAPYHTQATNPGQLPKLPPIESPRLAERLPDVPRVRQPLDRLYNLLPPDGSLPQRCLNLTDDELMLLRYHLHQHLQDISPDKMMDVVDQLRQQRNAQVPLDEFQQALTGNMILIPPLLLKLAGALFVSGNQPGSVHIDKLVHFLLDNIRAHQVHTAMAAESWTRFPAELVPILKMLPRHTHVQYESILLRPKERAALLGHLRESMAGVGPSFLKNIYHDLSLKDRKMTGCLPLDAIMETFDQPEVTAVFLPLITRLLASMHISRQHVGHIDYRAMLRLVEESLSTSYTSGPPALTLPPAPPSNLTQLLRLLPRNTDLPADNILLRETEKFELIRHVKSVMVTVTDAEMKNLHMDLAQYDRSLNGAVRYQDLANTFATKKINISPEILRLVASMFISAKAPGLVDYKKFMVFMSAAQKGLNVDVTFGQHETSSLDGLPHPPASILPLLRELPKQGNQLPKEPLAVTPDEQKELLTYLENHIHEFDPISIEGMYAHMESLDRDGRRYIHYSCILDEIIQRKMPIHPMIVRLLAAICLAPGTDNCVRYGEFMGFLGLAMKRLPRIPELMDTGAPPPLPQAILALIERLPKRGIPEIKLELTEGEKEEVRAQLTTLLKHALPEQIMKALEDFIAMDKRGAGVVTMDVIKNVLNKAQLSLPDRLVDLIAAQFVSPHYADHVDFKQFLAFIDSVIVDGNARRPFRGIHLVPDHLKPLVSITERHSDLPHEPLRLSEHQRVQLTLYLNEALAQVSSDDLNRMYEDFMSNDHYHDGTVPIHQLQTTILRHRIPIHKDVVRILAAMFVETKEKPNQVVNVKKLLMFLSYGIKSSGATDGDLPQAHTPRVPPAPPDLQQAIRSLPVGSGLPNTAVVLTESEKACLQAYLRATAPPFSSESFKTMYGRMCEADRYNTGTLSCHDMDTALQHFGFHLQQDILRLVGAMFVHEKSYGRIDYAKFIVFLNSTLNSSSNKDLMELTRLETHPYLSPPKTLRQPEMIAMFRLLPPFYQLPLQRLTLTDKEKEVILEDIRKNVWPLDKNVLKILYQQMATMDSKSLNYLPFEDIRELFKTKGITIDPDILRLIASQFVSFRMKGYVGYEDLINFLNEALKSPKVVASTDDPIGLRVELPPALVHVLSLLPQKEPLPRAPLFLKESERTMLAEAIHDVLRDYDDTNLPQLYAEFVRLDTDQVGTLTYAQTLHALNKYNVILPLDVARMLMAQFVRDEGRVEYRGVIEFLKAALRFIPELPATSRTDVAANIALPPLTILDGRIRPIVGRDDSALVRQVVRILTENRFNADRLREAFVSADSRRNGTLSAAQIRDLAKAYGAPLSDSQFDKVFEHLDYMGVGQFSWAQVVEFLQRCLDRGSA